MPLMILPPKNFLKLMIKLVWWVEHNNLIVYFYYVLYDLKNCFMLIGWEQANLLLIFVFTIAYQIDFRFSCLFCYWSWLGYNVVNWSSCGSTDFFDNVKLHNSSSITGQMHEKLMPICCLQLWIFIHSRLSTHCMNYKFMCLSYYWQWKLANEQGRISLV